QEERLVQVPALAFENGVLGDLGGVGPGIKLVPADPNRHEEEQEDGERRHHVLDHAAKGHGPSGVANEQYEYEEESPERDAQKVEIGDEPGEIELRGLARGKRDRADEAAGAEHEPEPGELRKRQ